MEYSVLGLAQVSGESGGQDPKKVTRLCVAKRGIAEIDSEVGRTCKALSRLDLSDNEIEDARPLAGLFAHNGSLTWLSLAGNRLSSVTALGAGTRLVVLNVSRNRIVSIDPLSGLAGLQALIATDNAIAVTDAVAGMRALNTLILSRNRLEDLCPAVGRLENLRKINLAENQLRAVPACISRLVTLQELRLNGNKIQAIPPFMRNLVGLRILDLGKNLVANTADIANIADMKELRQLNLAGNPVAAAPDYIDTVIKALPGLIILDGVHRIPKRHHYPSAPSSAPPEKKMKSTGNLKKIGESKDRKLDIPKQPMKDDEQKQQKKDDEQKQQKKDDEQKQQKKDDEQKQNKDKEQKPNQGKAKKQKGLEKKQVVNAKTASAVMALLETNPTDNISGWD